MENRREELKLTKTEYLNQLQKYLNRLPKADYENVMEHFTEYFEDAGSDGEQQVMEELGTPKEAAAEILRNLLNEDFKGPGRTGIERERKSGWIEADKKQAFSGEGQKTQQSVKRRFWIACLAIMAAPIAAPLAFTAVLLLLIGTLLLFLVMLTVVLLSLSMMIISAKFFIRGIVAIPYSLSGAGMITGTGIFGFGIGILLFILAVFIYKGFGKLMMYFARKITDVKRA